MARRRRIDRPGLLHHVINRGLARRTVFESRRDVRVFLALVARAVREGRIEVHAYAILATHFHLLVRSLDGRLSETMRRIENAYVRWFNRTRRRDGSLFRGRFRSIPVESSRYLYALLRYIDQNPVGARLVEDAVAYPYGSAGSQSGATHRRPWLCRTLVDQFLQGAAGDPSRRIEAYRRLFGPLLSPSARGFVDRRIAGGAREPDLLDDLVGTSSANVRAWMERKAKLADGTRPGMPMVMPRKVADLVASRRRLSPSAQIVVGARSKRSLWDVALVALLRDVAGETFESIGRRTVATAAECWRRYGEHRKAMDSDASYADVVTELTQRALEQEHAATEIDARTLAGVRAEILSSCDKRA